MGLSFSPGSGISGGRSVFTPSQSPFSDNAARDTWALANLSDVRNSATEFTRVTVGNNTQEWGGTNTPTTSQYNSESASAWSVMTTLTSGQRQSLDALEALPAGAIPFMGFTGLEASGSQVLSDGTNLWNEETRAEADSIGIGGLATLHESNSVLAISNSQFNANGLLFELVDARNRRTSPSDNPRVFYRIEAEGDANNTQPGDNTPNVPFTFQGVDTETITANPSTFTLTAPITARTNDVRLRTSAPMTNVRTRISYATGNESVIKYLPSESAWVSGFGGFDLTQGENILDLGNSAFLQQTGDSIRVELVADNVALLGSPEGLPYLTGLVQRGEFLDIPYSRDTIKDITGSGNILTVTLFDDTTRTIDITSSATTAANISIDDANLSGIITNSGNVQEALDRIDNTGIGAAPRTFTGSFISSYGEFGNQDTWYGGRQSVMLIGARGQPNGRYTFQLPDPTELGLMFDDLVARGLGEVYTLTVAYQGGNTSSIVRNAMTIVAPTVSVGFNREEIPTTIAQGVSVTFRISRTGGTINSWERVAVEQSGEPIATFGEVVLQNAGWNNANDSFLPPSSAVQKGYAFPVLGSNPNDGTLRQGLIDGGVSARVIYDGDYVVWTADSFTSWLDGDDWFVISRNSLQRISQEASNFLAQTSEIDNRVDVGNINALGSEAVVWLSENPLSEAPFITPSTDPNNPRSGDDYTYIGGRENRDSQSRFTFGQNRFNSYMTVGISPNFLIGNDAADIRVRIRNLDGAIIDDFNLDTDFTFTDDATFTNSTYRHYKRNTSVNYSFLSTIEVVLTQVQQHFRLNQDTVDVTSNIAPNGIVEQMLSEEIITKLNSNLTPQSADFSAIEPRLSPYKTVTISGAEVNARFLNRNGTEPLPQGLTGFSEVSTESPRFTGNNVSLAVAVPEPGNFALQDITAGAIIPLQNGIPDVEVVESLSVEGTTYFVFVITGLTAGHVYEVMRFTTDRVVAWADDISNLEDDITRIDAELDHAVFDLPDAVVQVLENDVTVDEEDTPTVVVSDYNRSLGNTDAQTVFYEPSETVDGVGLKASRPFNENTGDQVGRKLLYTPSGVLPSAAVFLVANNGAGVFTELLQYSGGVYTAKVLVPAKSAGSSSEKIYPTASNGVGIGGSWVEIETTTFQNGVPVPEADEFFYTRNLPTTATDVTIRYRGNANGNIFGENSIVLPGVGGPVDTLVNFTLYDGGEIASAEARWSASGRSIRISVTEVVRTGLPTIRNIQTIASWTETRVIPATPETTRDVDIEFEHAGGQVFAFRPSAASTLIIVGDRTEIDTGFSYTRLFGATSAGHLQCNVQEARFLNYEDFDPTPSTVTDLENHAGLPQFGLFTTNYTHETIVELGTQLTVLDQNGTAINVGQALRQLLDA